MWYSCHTVPGGTTQAVVKWFFWMETRSANTEQLLTSFTIHKALQVTLQHFFYCTSSIFNRTFSLPFHQTFDKQFLTPPAPHDQPLSPVEFRKYQTLTSNFCREYQQILHAYVALYTCGIFMVKKISSVIFIDLLAIYIFSFYAIKNRINVKFKLC